MAEQRRTMSGVLAPVITPFKPDLSPDVDRLAKHCRWLLSQNCGLAVFGTNSEANSLTVEERLEIIDRLVASGIDPQRMMPGTGCCSIVDSARLTKHAVDHGVGGVLMLPPFYYKNVSDEGIYRSFAEVIDRVGDDRLRIYLYHFPQMSAVPFSLDLVGRLVTDFPDIVVGMKDSSGDEANLEAVLRQHPGFGMFAGSEALLLGNLRLGGAGCISATANVNPAAIDRLFRGFETDEAEALQDTVNVVRSIVQKHAFVPALKAIVSHHASDPEWNRLRPPLVELEKSEATELIADLDRAGFEMPGLV